MKTIKIVLVGFLLFKSAYALNVKIVNCFPNFHAPVGEELVLQFYSEIPNDDVPREKCVEFRESFLYPNIMSKTVILASVHNQLPRKWTKISLDKALKNPKKDGLSIVMLKKGTFGGIIAETSYFSNEMSYIKK